MNLKAIMAGCLLAIPVSVIAQSVDLSDVGQVALANDGSAEAQQAFLHGLAQLHNFEYDDAADNFRRAQQIDPDFALAYWGEAMTYNHPIWMEQDREQALTALRRFAATPAARQAKAQRPLSRDLLAALDVLYGDGEKQARDDAYSAFMGELHQRYPDNVEVASFYALSIMGTAHEGRDYATYMRAAAIMQRFIGDYPEHPGVAHYLIHATDDPIHAPLGLDAANAYAAIAPNAAHAQHMTTHIFLALGDWDGVIRANTRASDIVNQRRAAQGQAPAGCGHYPSWLMYGYLQKGERDAAYRIMQQCYRNVSTAGSARMLGYFAWQRALYLFDTGEWDGEVAAMSADFGDNAAAEFQQRIIDGWVAVKRGESDGARAALERARSLEAQMQRDWDARGVPAEQPFRDAPTVELLQLEAMMADARGESALAIETLRQAVALEKALPFGFGPPDPPKPGLELLGEMMLRQGEPDAARELLKESLSRTPAKRRSLQALTTIAAD